MSLHTNSHKHTCMPKHTHTHTPKPLWFFFLNCKIELFPCSTRCLQEKYYMWVWAPWGAPPICWSIGVWRTDMHSLFIIIYKTAVFKFPPTSISNIAWTLLPWRPCVEPNGSWSALLRSWSPRPLWLHASCRCRRRSETHTPEMLAALTSAPRLQSPTSPLHSLIPSPLPSSPLLT